jgi:hypothetical protein
MGNRERFLRRDELSQGWANDGSAADDGFRLSVFLSQRSGTADFFRWRKHERLASSHLLGLRLEDREVPRSGCRCGLAQ